MGVVATEERRRVTRPLSDPLLLVRNVTMRFGGLTAVKSLNMTIPRCSLYGLIGPNGAGKTTVFNVLTGVYCPTEGEIEFDGTHIEKKKPYEITKLGAARTFQNIRLFADMTVLQNVMTAHHLRVKQVLADAVVGTRQTPQRRTGHARARIGAPEDLQPRPVCGTSRRRACRTAASGGWRLRGLLRPNHSCCSSTSPRPG